MPDSLANRRSMRPTNQSYNSEEYGRRLTLGQAVQGLAKHVYVLVLTTSL